MGHHLTHGAIAGGVTLTLPPVLSVDLRAALQHALLLACPLGRVGVMAMTNRQGGRQQGPAGGPDGRDRGHHRDHGTDGDGAHASHGAARRGD